VGDVALRSAFFFVDFFDESASGIEEGGRTGLLAGTIPAAATAPALIARYIWLAG
jgi:hypothetical protein